MVCCIQQSCSVGYMNFSERFFAHYRALFLIFAIFFIYLLIIYPACPARGKKSDDSTCTSHRFFFLSVLSQAGSFECPPFHSGHFQRKIMFLLQTSQPCGAGLFAFHGKGSWRVAASAGVRSPAGSCRAATEGP